MKAQHRHELQTNELAEWLENKIEQIKPYTQAIVGVLVAAAVLFGVYLYINYTDRRAELVASEQLVAALQGSDPLKELQAMIDDHPGTPPAIVAQLVLGEQLLNSGSNMLFTNKPEGRSNLSKAADAFLAVEDTTRDPMLRAWALFGLGRSRESLGELDRARDSYETLLKDYPDSSLADDTRQHLQNLDKPSTKEFYDWFAKQDPRPPEVESAPGTPGLKPSFDLSDPASLDEPSFDEPSFGDSSLGNPPLRNPPQKNTGLPSTLDDLPTTLDDLPTAPDDDTATPSAPSESDEATPPMSDGAAFPMSDEAAPDSPAPTSTPSESESDAPVDAPTKNPPLPESSK